MEKIKSPNGNDMLCQTIRFTSDGRVNMRTYIHADKAEQIRPAIIVLPGGAYGFLSEGEGEPVALTFFEKGFNTFVLSYSIGEYSVYPNPLDDVSKAIWEVRKNADIWGIRSDAIVLMGFSAGSGVAAMSATQWNTPGLASRLGVSEDGIKPNAAVIGYGAASNSELLDTPGVYVPDILGKIARDRTPELDVVNYVGPHTPPLFIWHNRYDRLVPAINPIMMAEAMQKNDLPYELHIFQEGQHGRSVGNNAPGQNLEDSEYPSVDMWVPLCHNWIKNLFLLERK
jgi:acetyl esterase/lipase